MSNRESWLNGWWRNGGGVLMGTAVHCAGCGKSRGLACVALSFDDPPYPEKEPDWPFNEADCPVCMAASFAPPVDKLTARALAMKMRQEQKP